MYGVGRRIEGSFPETWRCYPKMVEIIGGQQAGGTREQLRKAQPIVQS